MKKFRFDKAFAKFHLSRRRESHTQNVLPSRIRVLRVELELLAIVIERDALLREAAAIEENLLAGGIEKNLAVAADLARAFGFFIRGDGVLVQFSRLAAPGLQVIVNREHTPDHLPNAHDGPHLQEEEQAEEAEQNVVMGSVGHGPTHLSNDSVFALLRLMPVAGLLLQISFDQCFRFHDRIHLFQAGANLLQRVNVGEQSHLTSQQNAGSAEFDF